MNFFCLILDKPGRHLDLPRGQFDATVPPEPVAVDRFERANVRIVSYGYRKAAIPWLTVLGEQASVHAGVVCTHDFERPSREALLNGELEGEYCIVRVGPDGVHGLPCLGGVHSLFIAETDGFVAISNRLAMLASLPGVDRTPCAEHAANSAFFAYSFQQHTPFAGIRVVPNGSGVRVDRAGKVTREPPDHGLLIGSAGPITSEREFVAELEDVNSRLLRYLAYVHWYFGEPPVHISLSGGKDSRLILAYALHGRLGKHVEEAWTRGKRFTPEVLAAIDVAREAGLDRHEIRNAGAARAPVFRPGRVMNSVRLNEGMVSLFHFQQVAPHDSLLLQGHQIALRHGAYDRFARGDHGQFVDGAFAAGSNDPLGLIADRAGMRARFDRFFGQFSGAPVAELGTLFTVFQRCPSWVAPMSVAQYLSGPITNPLMISCVLRFAARLNAEWREAEAFHYVSMHLNRPTFTALPFANQHWEPELHDILQRAGLPGGTFAPPYRSQPSFPDFVAPNLSNEKHFYLQAMLPIVREMAAEKPELLDGLVEPEDLFRRIAGADRLITIRSGMAVFGHVLLGYYGPKLLSWGDRSDIEQDLADRAGTVGDAGAEAAPPSADVDERYEACIADLVRKIQALEAQLGER